MNKRKASAPVLQGICGQQQIHANLLKTYHPSTKQHPVAFKSSIQRNINSRKQTTFVSNKCIYQEKNTLTDEREGTSYI